MSFDPRTDSRLDPRLRDFLTLFPVSSVDDVANREELLADKEFLSVVDASTAIFDMLDSEENASSTGLAITSFDISSAPDGNTIKIRYIRPDTDAELPCVYYIHGGGMQVHSCFMGHYRAWARLIAAQGVAVVMVDFRNCLTPSSVPEVAPFPAGLNDCVSGLHWIVDHAAEIGINTSKIMIAGESGGGNLAIATALKLKESGDISLINKVYALCPFISGEWPLPEHPSATEFANTVIAINSNRSRMAYGVEAFNEKNPLAWPRFASRDDLTGLPPFFISVNELDPLRDEGLEFYQKLLEAGVNAQCRTVNGTAHGTEIFFICPEASQETARSIASFCAN
ncbi:MAG: acetyl esterase [Zhongshania sp.]|jgi:acetyl esterase